MRPRAPLPGSALDSGHIPKNAIVTHSTIRCCKLAAPVSSCAPLSTARADVLFSTLPELRSRENAMPFVAMTREMGSLGKDVAAAVADRLGKQVVHHEIIDSLASKMRLRKSHVIRFLEGKSGIWERLTTDKTSLSIYTADETFALVENGRVAVIRGWGAAHLLRPVPHVVSVRVCAPLPVRVKRMMERLHTDDRDFVENEIRL